jgi:cysteine desulfurase
MSLIYLDSNATTPVDPIVLEAMLPFLRSEFGNPSSAHPLGRSARAAIDRAREEVAALIGADPEEIAFTSGGSESSLLALLGGAEAIRRRNDGRPLRLLSFSLEHPATLRPLETLRERGDALTLIPPGPDGIVEIGPFLEALRGEPAPDLVSLIHAHNETGAIQPVERIGRAARRCGALFHVDAAQSIGKIPADVGTIGCHLLSIAGHKLYAPKGVGALYIRKGTELIPVLAGAGQERGLRGGTENVPGIVALGAACRLARQRLAAGESERLAMLRDRLWRRLREQIDGLAWTSENAPTLPNTLHLRFPEVSGNLLLAAAPEVAASTGSACHAGRDEAPSAIVALGIPEEEAIGSVRLSLGHGLTNETIDRAADALIRAWRSARGGNKDGNRR